MHYKNMTALITGASTEALERLANEVRHQTGVEVIVIPADLGSSDVVTQLITEVRDRGLKTGLLVNNAGLGVYENFMDTPLAKQTNQVDVNVQAVVASPMPPYPT